MPTDVARLWAYMYIFVVHMQELFSMGTDLTQKALDQPCVGTGSLMAAASQGTYVHVSVFHLVDVRNRESCAKDTIQTQPLMLRLNK